MLKRKSRYVVAVVGATGAVGDEMISLLEERDFPVEDLRLFASENSVGKTLSFEGSEFPVQALSESSFRGVDIALFSAGAGRSQTWAPIAVKAGCVVVDNSSQWRMNPDVPLVVPEVNPHDLKWHKGLIANPNCSTIQMVVALKPLHDAVRIKRVVVTTFQAVSGTGRRAMDELLQQTADLLNFREVARSVYPHQIAFNVLPHIDAFLENGYTKEEMKMVNETVKIMGDPSIRVTATAVRVPVFRGHSESVNIETEKKITPNEVRSLLAQAPGVSILDAPEKDAYPLPLDAAGKDDVFVGRIREDESVENGINMWIVSDNLRKGAALNAIQIAEELVRLAGAQ
ncbi:MAG: aspartate-semialdehyde dehydrogenase [Alphaproteobacteria bacterium]|uniref:Aspartate-semialdehyde dehydrogenase n=1 Tax=Candidatus Nitrobium versatile TaxID=2884831 RepID=A0A953M1T5_9BACT|nr:aspartate-semialdehyde dehydrogenase [Candidatus Nitrobium versatile]